METEQVNRTEFNLLKEEVNQIKQDMIESQKLLSQIDKKIDVINEKIITADKIDDLKFTPLEKRVETLEDNQNWLRKTVLGGIIGELIAIGGGLIIYVVQRMK